MHASCSQSIRLSKSDISKYKIRNTAVRKERYHTNASRKKYQNDIKQGASNIDSSNLIRSVLFLAKLSQILLVVFVTIISATTSGDYVKNTKLDFLQQDHRSCLFSSTTEKAAQTQCYFVQKYNL